jgi:hypothetical protein
MKFAIAAFALGAAFVNGECTSDLSIDLKEGVKKLTFTGFVPDVSR